MELPLTLRTPRGTVALLVGTDRPLPWAELSGLLRRHAGLASDAALFVGTSTPDDDCCWGTPPLLAGCTVSTQPVMPSDGGGPLVLDCATGPDAGRSIPASGEILIGRSPGAHLPINDAELSVRHAVVSVGRGGPTVRDLFSTNGIAVDGVAVDGGGRATFGVGSALQAGRSVLRLDLAADPPLLRSPDGRGHWEVSLPPQLPTEFAAELPPDPGDPPERTRRPLPLIASISAAVAGVAIALLTGMWMFLIFAALGPITMITSALGDRWAGRKPYKQAMAEYTLARNSFDVATAAAAAADRADAWERFADPARLLRWAQQATVRLWESRPGAQAATWGVVLSVGHRQARLPMTTPPTVRDVPLPVALPGTGVVGICGQQRGTLRWLVAQLAGRYSPAHLGMQILSAAPDLQVAADLPHLKVGSRVGAVHTTIGGLLDAIDASGSDNMIVVVDGAEALRDEGAWRSWLRSRRDGVLTIAIAATRHGLPADCDQVLDLDTIPGTAIAVNPDYLTRMTQALTPLSVRRQGAAALPYPLRAPVPSTRDIATAWNTASRPIVNLGETATGPLLVDLVADGPHVLIAGTTGSGKSELLQTLIAELVSQHSPQQLSVLFVDYKGGAAFAEAATLPHCAGIVTDLDPRLAARALGSLRAEIRRRERIAGELGVPDLGRAMESTADPDSAGLPPRLVICVDEFATLAADLPDFLGGLLDIAQRGRSLAMHLVLATQRPAGVLSPAIKANIATRICLRVTDTTDSTDVIDSPLAASIPAGLPGRGYLRTAGSPIQTFQTRQVTAPVRSQVHLVPRAAAGLVVPPAPTEDVGTVPLRAAVAAARDLAAQASAAGATRPPPPWLPELPAVLTLADPRQLGMIDLPDEQRQEPWLLPAGSVLMTGPPGSGRTTALRRWSSAVLAGGGQLAIVDGGTGLADLARRPGVSSYLTGDDPTLVLRLLDLLTADLAAPTSRARPELGVVIDGWDAIAAALDAVDYGQWQVRLAEIAGRGPAVGVKVAIAGGSRTSNHRAASAFATRLLLGCPDRVGEPIPGLPPGRARLEGPLTGEVQIATPLPLDETIGAANRLPHNESGAAVRPRVVVRPVPSLVDHGDLPPATAHLVPVGLGGDDAGVLGFDLTGNGGGLVIAGPRRSGVTTTLHTMIDGAATADIAVARIVQRPTPRTRDDVTDLDVRGGGEVLRAFLAAHSGPLLLVADELDKLTDSTVADLLVRYLAVAGRGQYLAVGARLDGAVRSHRGPINEAAAFRSGVLLGADSSDASLLDTVLPRRRGPAVPGRGHLVNCGVATALQVARTPALALIV